MTIAIILSVEVFCDRNDSSPRRTYKHHLEKGTRINGFCFRYKHFFLENEKIGGCINRYYVSATVIGLLLVKF